MRAPSLHQGNDVQRPHRYEEVTLASRGAPIVLSVWHGDSGGPVAVFLPGTMTHPLFYGALCDGLASAGVTVVGVHYEGHGKSPRTGRVLRWDNLAANVLDAVAFAHERFGSRPVVFGSSQGGVLAVAAATKGADVAGVVAHNVLDPELPDSLAISRLPRWLRPAYRPLLRIIRIAGRVLPRLPIPFRLYLDIRRVFCEPWTAQQFLTDPLGLRSYPLAFLADLFTVDLSGMRDGSIACPMVVVAGSGDPLFSLAYTKQVFERITAPSKELVVFDSDNHLLFNERLDLVLKPVADIITRLAATAFGSSA